MADFDSARADLEAARAASAEAATAARRATQGLQALQAQRAKALRGGARDQAAGLVHAIGAAQAEATRARAAAARAAEAALAAVATFGAFSDPRQNVTRLTDRSPFVLLPLRIEARFVTAGERAAVRHQLLLRIYPDDCSVDSFEPDLSASELANAKRYWRAWWRAGGVEADERAAWRGLVAAHGSGRAAWIVDHYQPANLPARPAKANATDVFLVIPTMAALSEAEAQAIGAYWRALWLAEGAAAASGAAQAALEGAVGAARAAELVAAYVPYNLTDRPSPPLTRTDVAVRTWFVLFPPDPAVNQTAWSQAPRVTRLADRFVAIGYRGGVKVLEAVGGPVVLPLYVGPDPSADPSETIHPDGPDLFVPPELRWMVDFEGAVATGMGLRIDIGAEDARAGFDRLLVLGLELATDETGTAALSALLTHHRDGRSGLAVVPQGTPTHNTAGSGTGYTRFDDPDQRFDDRKHAPLFAPSADPLRKRDGQVIAEALGVDPNLFATVHAAGGADQAQARAMQRALWPATVGYWMDKLMPEVFPEAVVEDTAWFFAEYVRGRGSVPAIRVGGQPYGILPTTAFSRIAWLAPQRTRPGGAFGGRGLFLERLLTLLRAVGADWTTMAAGVSHAGSPKDAHQVLLDIVGLHPDSVEFHARYAETIDQLFNFVNLFGFGTEFWNTLEAQALNAPATALLQRLGHAGTSPQLLKQYFFQAAQAVGTVVDDRPASEAAGIRAYTDDGRNYVRWLIDSANTSLDALYQEQGFAGGRSPETLLYLYLRHALMLGYNDTGYRLHRTAGVLNETALQALRPEPAFIHVSSAAASESRFANLLKTEPAITGNQTVRVTDYITANLAGLLEARPLAGQIEAMDVFADAPTAALVRLFSEHVDCCSYRFDAWLLGLVSLQLEQMRAKNKDAPSGTYLGVYGWLEDLRPRAQALAPAELPREIVALFPGDAPILRDPHNGGYIHAPSLVHARTAAVLRSGYIANATPANPDTLSVNLSSGRVRGALSLLEGIRNGQSFGALVGYQFERGLHDDHGLIEVDKFIYPMRQAFPLVSGSIATTAAPPGTPIVAIEARNVMDGLKLIERVRAGGGATYPFGLGTLPPATAAEADAINAEVQRVLDAYDAIADLALAEGVHQAVQGNFDRIAATLDTYSKGNFPPQPEVVQTPARGISLTHRVALHLRPGLAAPGGATPRAQAEPTLDDWLQTVLPPLSDIVCTVGWTDPAGAPRARVVSLGDLGLRPIDLLYLFKPDSVQVADEIDDRVLRFVIAAEVPRPDARLEIAYIEAPAGKLSVFQAAALLRLLKAMIVKARPLRATDAILHNEADPADNGDVVIDRVRIAGPKGMLDTLSGDIAAVVAARQGLLDDPVANRAAILAGIDTPIDEAVELLQRAALLGVPQTGWGFAYADRQAAFADLLERVRAVVARWNVRLAAFAAALNDYDALPPPTGIDARFVALRRAEMLVTTQPDVPPAAPATLRAALDAKGAAFATRRDEFQAILDGASVSLSVTLATAGAIATADLDPQGLDLAPVEERAIVLAEDLQKKLAATVREVDIRRGAVQAQLGLHDASAAAAARVDALTAGAAALFGNEFRLLPEFGLTAAQASEWTSAIGHTNAGDLMQYLGTIGVDDPVGEWLAGVARVRPNLRAFEQMALMAGAFGRPEPGLLAVQFPFEADGPWLAMEYPADTYTLDSDHLLYTAHYAAPFDAARRQTGLLLDEWTEVIPGADRDTGITFNYDRPNSEPAQSILLVTPASATGTWEWEDLLGALNETLDLARVRAVEPAQVDATPYARFVPATVTAVTLFGISISLALAAANGVYRTMEAPAHA